jgi:hypothetical protein
VVLDDTPRRIEGERRHCSVQARKREEAYSRLLEAAQAIRDAGVRIPQMDDAPPKTKQALSVANSDHREWKFVFGLVNAALKTANWKKVGRGASSPAVSISCGLLTQLGCVVTPDALAKMLKRAETTQWQKRDKWPL